MTSLLIILAVLGVFALQIASTYRHLNQGDKLKATDPDAYEKWLTPYKCILSMASPGGNLRKLKKNGEWKHYMP